MLRILILAAVLFGLLSAYYVTNTRIDRLTNSVERLTRQIERLLEEDVADISLVEGDVSIGRPQKVVWESGGNVITLKIYRATTIETAAEYTARVAGYVADYQAPGQYPPD